MFVRVDLHVLYELLEIALLLSQLLGSLRQGEVPVEIQHASQLFELYGLEQESIGCFEVFYG
jgi:hypothetical protein